MRLRPLTEAECYARCYGDVRSDQVVVLRPGAPTASAPVARESGEPRAPERREEAA